jgi:hypothetical protein
MIYGIKILNSQGLIFYKNLLCLQLWNIAKLFLICANGCIFAAVFMFDFT